jgi:hypothetical protein
MVRQGSGIYQSADANTRLQSVRNGSAWSALQEALPGASVWPDTSLDPAFFPIGKPANGTLDAHVADIWFGTPHISQALFVDSLKHLGTWNAASAATEEGASSGSRHNEQVSAAGPEQLSADVTAVVNQTAKHSLGVAVNSFSNALLALQSSSNDTDAAGTGQRIETSVEPFPVVGDERYVRRQPFGVCLKLA